MVNKDLYINCISLYLVALHNFQMR